MFQGTSALSLQVFLGYVISPLILKASVPRLTGPGYFVSVSLIFFIVLTTFHVLDIYVTPVPFRLTYIVPIFFYGMVFSMFASKLHSCHVTVCVPCSQPMNRILTLHYCDLQWLKSLVLEAKMHCQFYCYLEPQCLYRVFSCTYLVDLYILSNTRRQFLPTKEWLPLSRSMVMYEGKALSCCRASIA